MRIACLSLLVLATALAPSAAWAKNGGARVVGGNGLEAFGGVFNIAPNPDLAMEGPGRDIGRDIASHWVTYRWAAPARSPAACEVRLDRLDHFGFHAVMPTQAAVEEETAAHHRKVSQSPPQPWLSVTMATRPWGRLNIRELASLRDDGHEVLSLTSVYVEGPYTYTIEFFCNEGSLAEQRALVAAIDARNFTQS